MKVAITAHSSCSQILALCLMMLRWSQIFEVLQVSFATGYRNKSNIYKETAAQQTSCDQTTWLVRAIMQLAKADCHLHKARD